jgi:hypothetical protein
MIAKLTSILAVVVMGFALTGLADAQTKQKKLLGPTKTREQCQVEMGFDPPRLVGQRNREAIERCQGIPH